MTMKFPSWKGRSNGTSATYRIVRILYDPFERRLTRVVWRTGKTLEEAKGYIGDPETSHASCHTPDAMLYTMKNGKWFDIYEAEDS